MRALVRRRAPTAGFLLAGAASFVVAGVLAASPASATKGGKSDLHKNAHSLSHDNKKGNKGGDPKGTHAKGTVKINDTPIDTTGPGAKHNEPFVNCPFVLSVWGFTTADHNATVNFFNWPPTGDKSAAGFDGTVAGAENLGSFAFNGSGNVHTVDVTHTYALTTMGPGKMIHGQLYWHYKMDVLITSTDSKKVYKKSKVFWQSGCTAVSPTVAPTTTPPTNPTVAPTTATKTKVLGETFSKTPPQTAVKGVSVSKLPFTGPPPVGVYVALAAGLVLTGAGLINAAAGRRVRATS